jgi:dCMP deaminase
MYFMDICRLTATRSTCNRAFVGSIAIKDKRIIMSGYNGSPSGTAHCNESGHYIIKETNGNSHCIRTVHGEMNIICQCAKHGLALEGATLYCTHEPCFDCMKHIISSGISEVVYLIPRPDKRIPSEYYTKVKVFRYDQDKDKRIKVNQLV